MDPDVELSRHHPRRLIAHQPAPGPVARPFGGSTRVEDHEPAGDDIRGSETVRELVVAESPGSVAIQIERPDADTDHLLANRGLAELIREFVDCEHFEASVIPVHVVTTDLSTGEPVVLFEGPVLPALLASTAIPGVFPPVDVGGRLLTDGGVASDPSIREAESFGATTIYVLPTFGVDPDTHPRRATRAGLHAITQLFGHSGPARMAPARHSVVHLMPAPPTARISPYDSRQAARLIDQAAAPTRAWLTNEGSDGDLAATWS